MYIIGVQIKIGNKTFNRVHELSVDASAKVIEDTATIKIPATARLQRQGEFISEVETAKQFAVGDPVVISAGYDADLRVVFTGYVRRVFPGIPLKVECEDGIFLLRKRNLYKSFKNTTLKAILEYIVEGTDIKISGEVPGINFTHFYLKNVTAASALQKIKDEYGLTVYLKNSTDLVIGLAAENDNKTVKFTLGVNVIDNDLEWVSEEDVRLKIKAVHVKKDNTRVEAEYGDSDGETRTLFFYNVSSESQLKTLAEEEAKKLKFTGYRGGLNAFLIPATSVGNIVKLADAQFSERDGEYQVDKVVTTITQSGARQKVELGIKIK